MGTDAADGDARVDALISRGRPASSLDERLALSALEARLFDRPPRPLTVSRYVLVERLGEGASGLVYRAYDPQLDRKVAIKLLQASADHDGAGADRLLGEAQSLARLSHPNVVAVHDVGSYSELDLGLDAHAAQSAALEIPTRGVFMVMELLEGRTLTAWLDVRRRSWRDVVAVFAAAGRGLAAAHRADLVHRDFKPSNVIVGDDGRVSVLDFGLALAPDRARSAAEIAGTLNYMAPEQHRGEPADARSDQYAFAVALFAALTGGTLPFEGTATTLPRQKALGPGAALDRTARRQIPPHLRRLLLRALDPAPAQRHPSMDALLDALQDDPPRRRRRWALGAGAGLLVGAAALWAASGPDAADEPCVGVAAPIDAVWTPAARGAAAQRFTATGLPFAPAEWSRLEGVLDDYAARWRDERTAACEATQVRGEQSEALLDRRVACLDRRLRAFERTVGDLGQLRGDGLERAAIAVQSLPPLAPCADTQSLLRADAPPRDPRQRARVAELYDRLNDVTAEAAASHLTEARALATGLVEAARTVGYEPLLADAELALAEILTASGDFDGAREHLLAAVLAAEASHDDRKAAEARVRLLWVDGVERRQLEQGEVWARFAEAAVGRVGPDRLLEAQLAHGLGGLRYAQDRLPESLGHYRRALALQREVLGDAHPVVARTLNHIGNVLIYLEDYERAFEVCEQARAIRVRTLGDEHPLVAAALTNQAVVRSRQGRRDDAVALARRSAAIVAGSDTPEELSAVLLLAQLERRQGRPKAAREAFERAAALGRAMHRAEHWSVVTSEAALREFELAPEGEATP